MAACVVQRKESFTGEIVLERPLVMISCQRGVPILKVERYEVFDYFGIHSLFDAVANLFFFFASSRLDSDVIHRRFVRQHLKLMETRSTISS